MTQHRFSPSPEAAFLLAELARIPSDVLPDDARAALASAIRSGEVDALYKPLGADYWNICLTDLAPEIDPRVRLSTWVEWWQAAKSATAEVVKAYVEQQQQAWNEERARLQRELDADQQQQGGQPR